MSFNNIRESETCSEYEIPKVPIITEGEKLLKDMIDKQLNKNIRLQDELIRLKHFEQPTELINETEFLSGQTNLSVFKQRAEYLQNLQELKTCGLTSAEIELYSDNQKGQEYLYSKHKNICRTVLQEKLDCIYNKLKEKRENTDKRSSCETISRHVKEIALSTKPDSLATKLFQFATSSSRNETNIEILDHPMNSLQQLEKDLFGHLNNTSVPPLKKRRKKAKKFLESDISTEANSDSTINDTYSKNTQNSKWDLKEIPLEKQLKNKEKSLRTYSCISQRKYTIKNNEIVLIASLDEKNEQESSKSEGEIFISGKTTIEQNKVEKLSKEQIKNLPRFKNYEKGIPTNILFVKNLAKQTNEEDLINLFNCFNNETQKITYRLLTGKMKGQAFITFNSTDQATKALELLNGTIIKNKPIIIQYGKSA